jgi:hypothetical protein
MMLAALVAAQVKVTFVPAAGDGFGLAVNEVMLGGPPPIPPALTVTPTLQLAVVPPTPVAVIV